MSGFLRTLLPIVSLGIVIPQVYAQETRTWQDNTGKFSVKATLVEQDSDSVTLKKSTGETIRVPKSRLNPNDLAYLSKLSSPTAKKRPWVSPIVRMNDPKAALPAGSYKLEELQEHIGIPVWLYRLSWKKIDPSQEIVIPQTQGKTTIGEQLDTAFRPLDLTWKARDTILQIGPVRSIREVLAYRFPVTADGRTFEDTIVTRVDPESWLRNGGNGNATFYAPLQVIVIEQSSHVQRMIQKEFGVLPVGIDLKPKRPSKLMDYRSKGMALTKFVEVLQKELGKRVRIDEEQLDLLGVSPYTPIAGDFEQVSPNDLLDFALKPLECGWLEKESEIVITSIEYMDANLERLALPSMPLQTTEFGTDYSSAIWVIQQNIAPDSWITAGGNGQIHVRRGRPLIVEHSQPVLREVKKFVQMLARAKRGR